MNKHSITKENPITAQISRIYTHKSPPDNDVTYPYFDVTQWDLYPVKYTYITLEFEFAEHECDKKIDRTMILPNSEDEKVPFNKLLKEVGCTYDTLEKLADADIPLYYHSQTEMWAFSWEDHPSDTHITPITNTGKHTIYGFIGVISLAIIASLLETAIEIETSIMIGIGTLITLIGLSYFVLKQASI